MPPFLLNNKNGTPSMTTTMVAVGFLVINLKLLISGITVFNKYTMSSFNGTDYAAALAAIGGIHVWNKKINKTPITPSEEKEQ